jgi:hypothetical protein
MADTTYTIQTKSFADITTQYNAVGPNNWTRNETATFTFEFKNSYSEDTLTVTSTHTASGVETYQSVTVESGATLTIPDGSAIETETADIQGTVTGDGLLSIEVDFNTAFTNFAEWAGSWATLEMLNNVVKYRTQIPDDAGIDSLVWGIEPNQDLTDRNVVGVWGLVESINNERNQALSINRYTVDVTVLAPLDEYETIADVEADLVI